LEPEVTTGQELRLSGENLLKRPFKFERKGSIARKTAAETLGLLAEKIPDMFESSEIV